MNNICQKLAEEFVAEVQKYASSNFCDCAHTTPVSQEKSGLWGDLIAALLYLKGTYRKPREGIFIMVSRGQGRRILS